MVSSVVDATRLQLLDSSAGDGGGGLSVAFSYVTLRQSKISGNVATGSTSSAGGGGVFCAGTRPLVFTNTEVSHNVAARNVGGGILGLQCAPTLGAGTSVRDNSALRGGGAFLSLSPNPTLYGAELLRNVALDGGGALMCVACISLNVTSVTFDSNVAIRGDGGAVALVDFSTSNTFADVIFKNNTAVRGNGGAIALDRSAASVTVGASAAALGPLSNGTDVNEAAEALVADAVGSEPPLLATDLTLHGNRAPNGGGGGIFFGGLVSAAAFVNGSGPAPGQLGGIGSGAGIMATGNTAAYGVDAASVVRRLEVANAHEVEAVRHVRGAPLPVAPVVRLLDAFGSVAASVSGPLVSAVAGAATALESTTLVTATNGRAEFRSLVAGGDPGLGNATVTFTVASEVAGLQLTTPTLGVPLVACQPGQAASTAESTGTRAFCQDCPAGKASVGTPTGSTEPAVCRPCLPGHFAAASSAQCEPCQPGQYAPQAEATACLLCSDVGRGFVSVVAAAELCTRCTAGVASADSTSCVACPPGSRPVDDVCTPCPKGTASASGAECTACDAASVAPSEGMASCTPCGIGMAVQGDACEPCIRGTFEVGGVCRPCPASAGVRCEAGVPQLQNGWWSPDVPTLSWDAALAIASGTPAGGNSSGVAATSSSGGSAGNTTSQLAPTAFSDTSVFYKCRHSDACSAALVPRDADAGVNGAATTSPMAVVCGPGRDPSSPLCGACANGWMQGGDGSCLECSSGGRDLVLVVTFALVAMGGCAFAVNRAIRAWQRVNEDTGNLLTILRILASFLQLQGFLLSVEVPWPPALVSFFAMASASSSLPLGSGGGVIGCVAGASFYARLRLALAAPLIVAVALLAVPIAMFVRSRAGMAGRGGSRSAQSRASGAGMAAADSIAARAPTLHETQASVAGGRSPGAMVMNPMRTAAAAARGSRGGGRRRSTIAELAVAAQREVASAVSRVSAGNAFSTYFTAVLVTEYLLYPSIVRECVRALSCSDPVEGRSWLVSEWSVECGTDEYAAHAAGAIAVLVLFGIGFPAVAFVSLYRVRSSMHTVATQKKLLFLFHGFRPVGLLPAWEVTIMFRKFAVSVIAVSLAAAPPGHQTFAAALAVAAFTAATVVARPYVDPTVQRLETVSLLTSALSLEFGLLYVIGDLSEAAVWVVLTLMFAMNIGCVALFVVSIVREGRKKLRRAGPTIAGSTRFLAGAIDSSSAAGSTPPSARAAPRVRSSAQLPMRTLPRADRAPPRQVKATRKPVGTAPAATPFAPPTGAAPRAGALAIARPSSDRHAPAVDTATGAAHGGSVELAPVSQAPSTETREG